MEQFSEVRSSLRIFLKARLDKLFRFSACASKLTVVRLVMYDSSIDSLLALARERCRASQKRVGDDTC